MLLKTTISFEVGKFTLKRFGWIHRLAHETHCKIKHPVQMTCMLMTPIFRATNDSFFQAENSFLHPPAARHRTENAAAGPSQPPARPLSSADETGPVQKRLRSTTRQRSIEVAKSKPSKPLVDEPPKKARARPALKFANIFSSPGRRSQPIQNSRNTTGVGKNERHPGNNGVGPRRSTRLLSGATSKPTGKVSIE
jgi:anaphase-promoting complex subunit 3